MTEQPTVRTPSRDALAWIGFALAVGAVIAVTWACASAWSGIVHGHPAYAVWLVCTLLVAAVAGWRALIPRRRRRTAGARAGRIVLLVLAAVWIGITVWLRPYTAVEPALASLSSDAAVTVTESPTDIVLSPRTGPGDTALMFRPGALVDPRAYAAVLRPVAEAGHTVVIVKQPLGIGFLAMSALDDASAANPGIDRWVVGGHSLGGTVASMDAARTTREGDAVAGLLLYASYPADDLSETLDAPVASISGTRDGLSTPAKIDASRSDLPAGARFTVIDGASHAQFGDYGPQPGDGVPVISDDDARSQIADATVAFLDDVAG